LLMRYINLRLLIYLLTLRNLGLRPTCRPLGLSIIFIESCKRHIHMQQYYQVYEVTTV